MKKIQKPKEFKIKINNPTLEDLYRTIQEDRTWLENYIQREMRMQRYQYSGVYLITDFREHEEYIRKDQIHRIIDDLPLEVLEYIFNTQIDRDTIAPESIKLTTSINI